jgi:iron(III) transport system permease protein
VVVLLALALPLAVLAYWVVRGLTAGQSFGLVLGPALNSVYVSGLAAAATVVAGLPIAILAVRFPGRMTAVLERLSYTGFALPGIVVALALVFFGLNLASWMYQTLGLLVFAYVLLFLPVAVGALRTSLLQVSPRLEEAARSLGSRPPRVLMAITFPLIRPGILAGGALVFLVTMKELPATLVLGPIGFKTLATSTWSFASEAFFAQAAVASLLLVLASAAMLAFLVLPERRRS